MKTKGKKLLTVIIATLGCLCLTLGFTFMPANANKVATASAATADEKISLLDMSKELTKQNNTVTLCNGYHGANDFGWGREWHIPEIVSATDSNGATANVLKMQFSNSWGASDEMLLFDNPIALSEVGQLELKIYVNFSTADKHYTTTYGGVRLFSTDDTGATGEGYMIPGDIQQREWVTLILKGADLALLADNNGMLSGLQYANCAITTNDAEFLKNKQAYMYVESIIARKGVPVQDPLQESFQQLKDSGLVLASADNNYEMKDGTLQYINGLKSLSSDCARVINRVFTTPFKQEGAVSGNTLLFDFHSWGMVTSKTLGFKQKVAVSEVGGMVIRLYANLSSSNTYTTADGGIRFYGANQTGELSSGYLLPQNITQREWVELVLSKEEVELLADPDGYLSGFQIVGAIKAASKEQFYTGVNYGQGAGYLLIDYICISKPVTATFMSDGAEVAKINGYTGASLPDKVATPEKEGYVFGGWYNGENVFEFSSVVLDDITLTAKWVEKAAISEKAGLYYKAGEEGKYAQNGAYITVFEDGRIDFSDVTTDEIISAAIGTDNVIYAMNSQGSVKTYTIAEGEYVKLDESVKVTFDYGNKVSELYIAKGDKLKAFEPTRAGYIFNEWVSAGVTFNFATAINADVVITAVWDYDELSQEMYEYYYGKFYDDVTDKMIILAAGNKATVAGVEMEYHVLSGGVIVFVNDGVSTDYTLLAQRIISPEGNDYYRLGTYVILFDSKGGTEVETIDVPTDTYKIEKPADPVKDGYVFKGWVLLDGTEFDFNQVIDRSTTLYAKWEKVAGGNNQQSNSNQSGNSADTKNGCGSTVSISGVAFITLLGAGMVMAKRKNKDE